MKTFRLVVIILFLCVCVMPRASTTQAVHAETHSDCELTWELVPSPDLGTPNNQFNVIEAESGDNVWAIGAVWGNPPTLLLEHWNGSAWTRVDAPDLENGFAFLNPTGLIVLSENDAWGVGWHGEGPYRFHSFVIHWDGTSWSVVPLPTAAINARLFSISGGNSNDIWAVGEKEGSGLLLHWNGSAWETLANPLGDTSSEFARVLANASDDVWLLGTYIEGNGILSQKFARVLHWDGVTWEQVTEVEMTWIEGYEEHIHGFTTFAGDDVWLLLEFIGASRHLPSWNSRVMHWDGTQWHTVEQLGYPQWHPSDLKGQASDNVSVIPRQTIDTTANSLYQVRHWNGETYRELTLPAPNGFPSLRSVAIISPTNVWIVGDSYGYPNPNQPYIAHGHMPCAETPLAPQLSRPKHKKIVAFNHPSLRWHEVNGALYYDIEMRKTRNSAAWLTARTFTTSYVVMRFLKGGQTYFWRVRACNNVGCGEWSKTRKFTILVSL